MCCGWEDLSRLSALSYAANGTTSSLWYWKRRICHLTKWQIRPFQSRREDLLPWGSSSDNAGLLRPGSPAVTSQTGSLSQWGRSSVTGRRRPQGYHIDNAVCITLINAPQDVTPVLSGFLFSEGCSPFVPLPTALPSGLQSVCVHRIAITGCIHYKPAI